MIPRRGVAAGALIAGLCGAAAAPPTPADAEHLAHELVERAGLQTLPCPDDLVAVIPEHRGALCGLRGDDRHFRRNWRAALKSLDVRYRSVWHAGKPGVSNQLVLLDQVVLRAFLDRSSGFVAVVYPGVFRPCPGEPTLELPDVETPEPGSTQPRGVRRFFPDWPAAMSEVRPRGRVLVEGIVDRHGVPSDLCIRGVTPLGAGLEEMAIDAIGKWEYEPGRKDGVPVDWPSSFFITFEH